LRVISRRFAHLLFVKRRAHFNVFFFVSGKPIRKVSSFRQYTSALLSLGI
jgi:hypothetical protein